MKDDMGKIKGKNRERFKEIKKVIREVFPKEKIEVDKIDGKESFILHILTDLDYDIAMDKLEEIEVLMEKKSLDKFGIHVNVYFINF